VTAVPCDPFLGLTCSDIFHAKDSGNKTGKKFKLGDRHKTPIIND
jgi:hypothetical protein